RVDSVESAYKSADNSLSGRITSLQTTVTNGDDALSDRIDLTNATINGVSATVTSHSQAIASINNDGSDAYQAMWSQKASAGDVTAGIGILAGAGGVSQVAVSASQFFVFNPNSPGTLTPTFAIDNGKVIIPETMIEKATIQILNAQEITADYVRAGISITSPAINGGTLTGAVLKVGAGGPWAGYNFYVDSKGNAYVKGHIQATSGSMDNVTIKENCDIQGKLSVNQIEGDVFKGIVFDKEFFDIGDSNGDRGTYLTLTVPARDYPRRYWFPEIYTNSTAGYLYVYLDGVQVYYSGSNNAGSAKYDTLRYFGFYVDVPASGQSKVISIDLKNQTPSGTTNGSVSIPKQKFLVTYWKT
ncbi:phage tail tip protein, partial [Vibrio parahaemolyticus]